MIMVGTLPTPCARAAPERAQTATAAATGSILILFMGILLTWRESHQIAAGVNQSASALITAGGVAFFRRDPVIRWNCIFVLNLDNKFDVIFDHQRGKPEESACSFVAKLNLSLAI
jgi:hypothetical protein